MYLKTIKILIVALMVAVSVPVSAQKVTFSPYSRYGIGDIYKPVMGQNVDMGYSGIANSSSIYLNNLNPAGNAELPIQRFIFDVGMDTKYTTLSSATTSQKNNNTTFKYLAGGFAAKPWWNFLFALRPYSAVGYSLNDTTKITNPTDGSIYKYEHLSEGSGGLNSVMLSTSFTLFKMLSVGVKGSYLWGSLDRYNYIESLPTDINDTYTSSIDYNNRYILHGFTYEIGAMLSKSFKSKKDTLKNAVKINAGFTFTNKSDLKSRNELLLLNIFRYGNSTSIIDTLCNDTLSKSNVTIPSRLGVGVAVDLFERLTLTADYAYQDWKKFDLEGENNTELKKSTFLGAGAEFVFDRYSSRFFKTILYRVGFHTEDTYLNLNGTTIKDKGITCGIGLPLRTIILNFGGDFGSRGTTDNNLYKEKYFLIHFNVTIHDIWFVKRKFQ